MNSAERFLLALSAAAYDRARERRGDRIFHFFDSDFVHRVVFGYRDPHNQALLGGRRGRRDLESVGGQRLLMGALIGRGIGVPPLIRALPPHLFELQLAALRQREDEDAWSFKTTVELLGIEELLTSMIENAPDLDLDATLREYLRHGPAIFYGVELLSGVWKSRLMRLLEHNLHGETPFDFTPEAAVSSGFGVIHPLVGHLPGEGRVRGVAARGLRDSLAVAMLSMAVDQFAAADESPALVRFYTETRRITDSWEQSSELRELLTYSPGGDEHEADPSVRGAMRSSYYYLIRALMPEFDYAVGSEDADEEAVELAKISWQLADAIDELRRGGVSERELIGFQVGGSTLGEYMAKVLNLSSYGPAWRALMNSMPPDLPRAIAKDLREILAEKTDHDELLEESFRQQIQSLSEQTEDMASLTEGYVHLLETFGRVGGTLRPRYGGYFSHFGLARWGFPDAQMDERLSEALVEAFEEWAEKREPSGAGFVAEIAARLRGFSAAAFDPDELRADLAVLGFLWLVGDHVYVQAYGRKLLHGIALRLELPIGTRGRPQIAGKELRNPLAWVGGALENMVAAAAIRCEISGLATSREPDLEVSTMVDDARRAVDALSTGRRTFPSDENAISLVQGYILFHVWQALNPTAQAEYARARRHGRFNELATRSIEVCMLALERCDPDTAMYPLLLNHCLYVATILGLSDSQESAAGEMARRLVVFRNAGAETWSYRFDDTLAYFYCRRGASALMRVAEDSSQAPALMDSACKDLQEARRWLADVPDDSTDFELRTHRSLLREFEAEFERLTASGLAAHTAETAG